MRLFLSARIPFLCIIDLLLHYDCANDQQNSKTELQYNQHFSRCDECVYFFKATLQHFNGLERRKKESGVTACEHAGKNYECDYQQPKFKAAERNIQIFVSYLVK